MAKWRNVKIFVVALLFGAATLPVAGVSAADPPGDRGYTAYAPDYMVLRPGGYTFRLVQSANVEKWRSATTQTAQQLADATGLRFTVARGTVSESYTKKIVNGEILVFADQPASVCAKYKDEPASGCANFAWDNHYNLAHGGDEIPRGAIWLYKGSNGKSAKQKLHVMLHEAGHVMGLQHREAPYRGKTQVMHRSSYAATAYQEGDINGLKRYADYGRRSPTGKVTSVTSEEGEFTVKGTMSDPSGPNQSISVVINTESPLTHPDAQSQMSISDPSSVPMIGEMNGTFRPPLWTTGRSEACVTLVNVGGGANKPVGCFPIDIAPKCPQANRQNTSVITAPGPGCKRNGA